MNEPEEPATEDSLHDLATEADAHRTAPTPPVAPVDDAALEPEPDPEPEPAPAAELARLREEAARQKAEIARLTRLTSLQGGSGPGTPPAAPKRFAELSDREMEAEIGRMATEIDGF